MATGKFVSYLRVSTARQGRSGLGIEAQREAVKTYLDGGRWKLLKEFVEHESGKDDERPKLAEALHLAKVTGATLIVAKLDRLSRNVSFLSNLQDSKVKFIACDLPEANEFTINIMAAVAQHERKIIGERTRVAMASAKKKGRTFGNPNGARALRRAAQGNDAAVSGIKIKADKYAKWIKPIVDDIRASGATTLSAIAEELNARDIKTANKFVLNQRGELVARDPNEPPGTWYASTVRNITQRIKEEMAAN